MDALAKITVASHEIENDYPAVVLFARHVERMTLLILRDQLITRNITEEFMQSLIRRCPKGSLSLANVLGKYFLSNKFFNNIDANLIFYIFFFFS